MARIRTIKPEFWEDEKIGSLSHGARLLFLCCLNLSDDEGILRWNALYLASNAFMYDEIKTATIDKWMNELVDNELIYVYQAGSLGQKYGYIINFSKHQNVNRPQPSKLPRPKYDSVNVHGVFTERSLTEKEGKVNISTQDKSFVDITPLSPYQGKTSDSTCQKSDVTPLERKEKVARKRKEHDLSFVEPAFQPIMADWLAYKSERGQTYQRIGLRRCYSRLLNLSDNDAAKARQVVDASIANNYAGLFPLRDSVSVQPRHPATAYHFDQNKRYEDF